MLATEYAKRFAVVGLAVLASARASAAGAQEPVKSLEAWTPVEVRPEGPATAGPPPPASEPKASEARTGEPGGAVPVARASGPREAAASPATRRNPRASARLSGGLLLVGPTSGLGMVVEYLPHWIAALGLGVGGTMRRVRDDTLLGAGTFFGEISLLPAPFVLTPVLGAGFAFTFGPLAEYLPGFAGSAPKRDQFVRMMPYGRFGLRVDLRRFYVAGDVVLAPDNRFDQGSGIHPLPSLRIGLHVL